MLKRRGECPFELQYNEGDKAFFIVVSVDTVTSITLVNKEDDRLAVKN
jgi:hypothetical protein